jgi:multidrug resistance efflux pump
MNPTEAARIQNTHGKLGNLQRRILAVSSAAALGSLLISAGCSSDKGDQEPTVTVQVAPVEETTIQHTISAQAILYPRQQAAIVPKISAPVQRFLVKRGSKVRQGQLLAVLENRDLSAAAQENKGSYEQAQATYETTTATGLPEEIRKAEADAQQAKQVLDAQEKVFQSRQELFDQGALPRKELDQSRVDVTQARNQSEITKKHLDALMAVGKQQALKSAAGQLESAKGKFLGSQAQLGYSEIRSPIDGVITDRPLYPGEMAAAGTALLTVMDVSSVIAKAHIPQNDAAVLKVGDTGTMTVPGIEEPIEGKVTVVSPALDPNSTTVEVWLEAKNPKQALKPGTSVQLSLTAQTVNEFCGHHSGRSHRGHAGGFRWPRSPEGGQTRHPQWRRCADCRRGHRQRQGGGRRSLRTARQNQDQSRGRRSSRGRSRQIPRQKRHERGQEARAQSSQ